MMNSECRTKLNSNIIIFFFYNFYKKLTLHYDLKKENLYNFNFGVI